MAFRSPSPSARAELDTPNRTSKRLYPSPLTVQQYRKELERGRRGRDKGSFQPAFGKKLDNPLARMMDDPVCSLNNKMLEVAEGMDLSPEELHTLDELCGLTQDHMMRDYSMKTSDALFRNSMAADGDKGRHYYPRTERVIIDPPVIQSQEGSEPATENAEHLDATPFTSPPLQRFERNPNPWPSPYCPPTAAQKAQFDAYDDLIPVNLREYQERKNRMTEEERRAQQEAEERERADRIEEGRRLREFRERKRREREARHFRQQEEEAAAARAAAEAAERQAAEARMSATIAKLQDYDNKWSFMKHLVDENDKNQDVDPMYHAERFPWPQFNLPDLENITEASISEFIFHPNFICSDKEKRSRRLRVREELRKWHPDKFNGLYLQFIHRHHELVKQIVGKIAVVLIALSEKYTD